VGRGRLASGVITHPEQSLKLQLDAIQH
jgi:hypothetical protein